MRYFVTFPSGDEVAVDLEHLPTGELSVSVSGRRLEVDAPASGAAMRLDGRVVDLWMEGAPPGVGVIAHGHRFYAKVEDERMRAASALRGRGAAVSDGTVVSPMPGRVLKVLVSVGDAVAAGAPLVVIEAMKMENEMLSPRDGEVLKVHVAPGQTVESGARLLEVG